MSASEIPVIDISNPSPGVAKQVFDAASTHGFLFIKNDGLAIPQSDIDAMFSLSKAFFASPTEHKAEYAIHSDKAGGVNRGWVRMSGEALDPSGTTTGDPKEAFNMAPPSPGALLQPLPTPLSTHSPLLSRFQSSCQTLCTSILSLLSTALEIPDPSYFSARHDQSKGPTGSIFRLLYYPRSDNNKREKNEDESVNIRAGAHSDYGSITLLFRETGNAGLQLLSQTGEWINVPVDPSAPSNTNHTPNSSHTSPPPPILINIGDLLCYWTAGLLKSTVHRVTFSGGVERYSMAYFCHPLDEVRLERVPGSVIEEFGGRGAVELGRQRERLGFGQDGDGGVDGVITAKEHLEKRLKVTYGL